ncbi:M20/M25/M40 family metallo-hydrolase [Allosphingosinicella flava]|uniref:M20/M25/M40 family metallo-hydrolase n=1 Tax=Allosphingosinicella flava TaxID=2771430 RepID=A0A7T2LM25_9SPHN|nr:M28 family metallopeptidase [Sphingosinicella flava]QPQ55106.1 M20/M25/M40 family metallo-hydrolase [Sphingosinicella flava]
MRFKLPAAILAAASCASIVIAQTPAQAPAFTADAFRSHVAFLSDDLLEGRDTGSRGHEIAARYVATQLAGLGVKPGNQGSWYQQVPFGSYMIEDGAALSIGDTRYDNFSEVIVNASPREPALSLEAPVVFAGYGLDSPSQGFNDYAGLDVKGKIVLIIGGTPKGTPSDLNAHLNGQKGVMAAKNGAIGVIQIARRDESQRRPWESLTRSGPHPSVVWSETDGKPYSNAPAIRFSASMSHKAAALLFKGSGKTLEAVLDQADKEGGKPKGFALKPKVAVRSKTSARTFQSPNVVGMIEGSDPVLKNEYVVLMAHLDHVGIDPEREGADKIFNGAMDNATGVATLIEAARAMMATKDRPKRSILLAAVTAEEKGLQGSQYLAKHPVVGGGKVVSVVNLDMPILTYDFQDVIAFGAEHSTMGQTVEKAGANMGVKLIADPLPEERLFTRSDHYRFVQEGIPSVFLMTGFGNGGGEKFRHFLATDYHKVSDQITLPFNWEAGAKFARLNYEIAREIADAPQAPRWYEGNFFGNAFAPGQPRAVRR